MWGKRGKGEEMEEREAVVMRTERKAKRAIREESTSTSLPSTSRELGEPHRDVGPEYSARPEPHDCHMPLDNSPVLPHHEVHVGCPHEGGDDAEGDPPEPA